MALTIEQLQKTHDALAKQNETLIKTNDFGKSRKNATTKIIRSIAVLLVILLIFNLFIMFQLNTHLMNIVQKIDTMKDSFSQVSNFMGEIEIDVKVISQIMVSLPDIQNSMRRIDSNMPIIAKNMGGITNDVGAIDQRLLSINNKIYTISQKMNHISDNTTHMQNTMQNIAKPTRYFNWMLPN